MTVESLRIKLKQQRKTIITNAENNKVNRYKQEFACLPDENINGFNKKELIRLLQRYHAYTGKPYKESIYSKHNLFQLKAEAVKARNEIKKLTQPDTTNSMEDKEIILNPATSNKMIESLTHKAALQTFKNHLLLCEVSMDETEFANLTKTQLQSELKTFRNDLIKKQSQPTPNNHSDPNIQSQPN